MDPVAPNFKIKLLALRAGLLMVRRRAVTDPYDTVYATVLAELRLAFNLDASSVASCAPV